MASVRHHEPPPETVWRAACAYGRLGALCLALMGIGLCSAAPIHIAFHAGDVTSPHTPLYARENAELRDRVVAKVATAGAYLSLIGLGLYAGQCVWHRLRHPDP